MAAPVTFSRNLNIEWLNAVAEYRLEGRTRDEAADALNELVSRKIVSKDNIRKSRTLLLSIWYDNDPWFLNLAVKACRDLPKNQWLPVHWALMLIKFPIFYDVCDVAGKLLDYKESITIAQIQQRVFEKWGARNTMLHTLPKIIQTLKDIHALNPGEEKRSYKSNTWEISDVQSAIMLTAALLSSKEHAQMTWSELSQNPAIFPFELTRVSQADVASCEKIRLEKSGNEIKLRLD